MFLSGKSKAIGEGNLDVNTEALLYTKMYDKYSVDFNNMHRL